MWWKTTEVYRYFSSKANFPQLFQFRTKCRVPLPYAKINALNDVPIEITSKIGIFTHSVERSTLLVTELRDLTKDNDLLKLRFEVIALDIQAATPAILESRILKQYTLKSGDFVFLEWQKFTEDILITSERSAMISNQTSTSRIFKLKLQNRIREFSLFSCVPNPPHHHSVDNPRAQTPVRDGNELHSAVEDDEGCHAECRLRPARLRVQPPPRHANRQL